MDVVMIIILLACFGSMALLTLWCVGTAAKKER